MYSQFRSSFFEPSYNSGIFTAAVQPTLNFLFHSVTQFKRHSRLLFTWKWNAILPCNFIYYCIPERFTRFRNIKLKVGFFSWKNIYNPNYWKNYIYEMDICILILILYFLVHWKKLNLRLWYINIKYLAYIKHVYL